MNSISCRALITELLVSLWFDYIIFIYLLFIYRKWKSIMGCSRSSIVKNIRSYFLWNLSYSWNSSIHFFYFPHWFWFSEELITFLLLSPRTSLSSYIDQYLLYQLHHHWIPCHSKIYSIDNVFSQSIYSIQIESSQ